MNNFLEKILGDMNGKREWKVMEKRAKLLPHDYRVAYEEIKQYIWKSSGVSTIDVFKVLLDMFEEGAANNKKVLDITGSDVAAFCDELVRGEQSYFEDCRKKLNKNIAKKLDK